MIFFWGGGGIRLFLGQPQSHIDHIPIVFDRHPYYLSSLYSWITNNLYEFKENGQKNETLKLSPIYEKIWFPTFLFNAVGELGFLLFWEVGRGGKKVMDKRGEKMGLRQI